MVFPKVGLRTGMGEFLDLGGQGRNAGFEFGEARFELFDRSAAGVAERNFDGEAGHFGDAGKPVGEAEFAKVVMFFAREPEADHVAAGFGGHIGERKGGTPCASRLRNELWAWAIFTTMLYNLDPSAQGEACRPKKY